MSNIIIRHTWRTDRMLKPHDLSGFAFVSEAQAHTFIIDGYDGKNAVPISGRITATCLGATGVTIPLIGEVNEDGMAVVTMTPECYTVPGQFDLTIYATANDVTQAIYEGIGVMKKTATDTTAYPTETIPNLLEMVDQVNAAIASIPPASEQLISDVENVVLVQQNEPEEENNKLWVPTEDMQEVQVPTYAEHEALSDEVTDLKSAFNELNEILPLSAPTDGYIADNGNPVTSGYGSCTYSSVTIDETLVGNDIFVSGSAWWSVQPYVFVGTSTAIVVPGVENPGNTPTQYTGLQLTPTETGTLYINKYGAQIGTATVIGIGTLKKSELPYDAIDVIKYYPEYEELTFTLTSGRLLNASTGEIIEASNQNWKVSDYIDISDAVSVKVTTEMFYGYALYVFYDANKGYLSGRASEGGATVTSVYLEKTDVPENAKYLVIGYLYQAFMPNPYVYALKTSKSVDPTQKWNGLKWACVGDSLTDNNDRTSYHYFDYIADETGITPINMGASGTGYANGQESSTAFYQRIQNIDTSVDVITIFGSFNDLATSLQLGTYTDTGTTTIAGCINATLDNLYSAIPLANVAIVSPTPWNDAHPGETGTYLNYVDLLEKIAEYRSVPFLNLWKESGLRPWDTTFKTLAYSHDDGNGVHPDAIGHRIIAPKFKALLEKML